MKLFFPILFFSVITTSSLCFSQTTTIDNAKLKIYQSKTDATLLHNLLVIGKLRNSLHGDTLYRYALWTKQIALKLNDKKAQAWADYSIISSDLAKGKTDSVLYKIETAKVFNNVRQIDPTLYYKIQLLKANALNRINNRTAALDLQLRLLNEAEKEGNVNAQLFALNYIGATYLNVNNPAEAKQAWQKGLQIINEVHDTENNEIEAYILSNLALLYFNTYYVNHSKQLSDSFFMAITKAIALSEQVENLSLLASSLTLRGNFYGLIQQTTAGEQDFTQGLAIRKKVGDPLYILNDFGGLSSFYYSRKLFDKCIATANEGLMIANHHHLRGTEVFSLLKLLCAVYKTKGDFKQYSITLEKLIAATDSNQLLNASEKIAEIQTKYEVQKKETVIAQQKLELFQRNLFLYSGVICTLLLFVFLFYQFKKYQRKQKRVVSSMMEEKKREHDTELKESEEKERKRIAAELHDNLGVQANAILHSSSQLNKEPLDNKKLVDDLQETAKEMLHNLRETLWALKTTDVSATDLWLRIINFMMQMGRRYTSLHFKIEGETPEQLTIASSRALNIVLVLQETINNAVKHANATSIYVTSKIIHNDWIIMVKDDGQGFDLLVAEERQDSYGLQNMKDRARAANFRYMIETAIGKGTATTLTITL